MKKLRLILLLVLCLPVFVSAATIEVKDATPYWGIKDDGKKDYIAIGNGIHYLIPGKTREDLNIYRAHRTIGGSQVTVYHYNSQIHAIKYKNVTYPTVCIDPGLANSGGTLTCEKVKVDADKESYVNSIRYLFKTYGSKINDTSDPHAVMGLQLSIRTYARKAGIGVRADESQTGKAFSNVLMEAIANRIGDGVTSGRTLAEAATTDYDEYKNVNYDDSVTPKGKKYIDDAVSYYNLAQGLGAVDPDAGDTDLPDEIFDISVESEDCDTKTFVYKITSKAGTLDSSKFVYACTSGCTNANLSFSFSGTEGTMTVTGVEKFDIDISYESLTGTEDVLYICYKKGSELSTSTNQKFLFYKSDEEVQPQKISRKKSCDCETCTDDVTKPKKNISMCCEDSTDSSVQEPDIRDLFCDYKSGSEVFVEGFINKCPDKYKVSKVDSMLSANNDYCEVYCSERIFVKVPAAIEKGDNGKYFELSPVEGHPESYGPYIKGHRTCRIITKYDTWVTDYKTKSTEVKDKFNEYQAEQAKADMYKILYENNIDGKAKHGVNRGATQNRTVTYSGSYVDPCSGNTVNVSKNETEACYVNYTAKIEAGNYTSVTYRQAELKMKSNDEDTDAISAYKGLYIKNGTDLSTSAGTTGLYEVEWSSTSCDHTTSDTKGYSFPYECKNNLGVTTSSGTFNYSLNYSSVTGNYSDIKSTLDTEKSTAEGNASAASESYTSLVGELNDLEKYLEECDTYFETGLGTKKNDDGSYKLYSINPTVSFTYFMTYIDVDDGETKVNVKNVPFNDVVCTYTMEAMKENSNEELGLEGYHYNTKNVNTIAKVKNFNVSTVKCLNNSSKCPQNSTVVDSGLLDATEQTHSQRFTSDAYYKAECKSNTQDVKSYIVYPYGTFVTTSEGYGTYEEYHQNEFLKYRSSQYFVEYSAFEGKYETYWILGGLGTDGKFDEDFELDNSESTTCSATSTGSVETSEGSESEFITCTLRVQETITKISGCDEDGVLSLITDADNEWSRKCCIKCDPEDTLTYSFKTVDSNKLFPDGGIIHGTETEYAVNWLKPMTVDGVTVPNITYKEEIEERADLDKTFDPSRLSYEFNLTISDLELIRKYNEKYSYNDFAMTCSSKQDADGNDILFYNCRSEFIDNFYSGIIKIGNTESSIGKAPGAAKLATIRDYSSLGASRHVWPQ